MTQKLMTIKTVNMFKLHELLSQNKPTCAQVAAMTTVAHNTSKQLSVNAKVNFSRLLPDAHYNL